MSENSKVSRRAALGKIAGFSAVGYFAPTMGVMAVSISAPSAPSRRSRPTRPTRPSPASPVSFAEDPNWVRPTVGESGNPNLDVRGQACVDSSVSEESFADCLSKAGLQIAN